MKISASIYSNRAVPLEELVTKLEKHEVEYLHIDCKDDVGVFDDIRRIRAISRLPLDLHIITSEPEKFFPLLREHPVELVTFQFENLTTPLNFPADIGSAWGLALVSDTPVEAFAEYAAHCDFVLFMTTVPGESGGAFNKDNFKKIRAFQRSYPHKRVHVDGGVNAEVSFILRNMGVYCSVSGSYLVKDTENIGLALVNLRMRASGSSFKVGDFMHELDELPVLPQQGVSLREVLQCIEDYRLGFCLLTDTEGRLAGLISNADLRRGLMRHIGDLNGITVESLVNPKPKFIRTDKTVRQLLEFIKHQEFPILYLPVVDEQQRLAGAVTFNNLVKGEL
jgi:pentose-5-phosphate-3-epimerase